MRRAVLVLAVLLIGVLVIGAVFLLMPRAKSAGVRLMQLTTTHDSPTTDSTHGRRYSTSDEMRYILYGVDADQFSTYDQQLASYILSQVSGPSPKRPRQLTKPTPHEDASQFGQSMFVDRLLSGRRNGFFVECGAYDGEIYSNSLFFELKRNWTGLLIEANPEFHRALLDKNRRAYVLGSCLSTERKPATVHMQPAGLFGGIADKMHPSHLATFGNEKPNITVNCFPLNAIMAALGVSHVDYLSLDVEGPELEILRTIDWTRLRIDVITVEYRVYGGTKVGIDKPASLKELRDLRQFFLDTGMYREVGVLPIGSDVDGLDVVFSRI